MKAKPILSIIVLSFNTKDLLEDALKSIYKSENNHSFFEVIVFDNDSKDDSVQMVRKNFSKVKLMANNKNIGFARANNLATQQAKGKYLLFLNSDTLVKKYALSKIVKFLEKHPKIGVLGPKLILNSGKIQSFCIGYKLDLSQVFKNKLADILFKLDYRGNFLSKLSLEYWNWLKPKEVDWVTGAALIIKKDLFKELKGFDLKFFMYFEDQDLCIRAKENGFEVWVLPKAEIIHLGGKSIKLDAKRKKYYYQSQDYFFKKHFGFFQYWLMKILSLPIRLIKRIGPIGD